MQNDWILDVLTDLSTFAHQNGFGVLAEQIDDTRLVAAAELATEEEQRPNYERTTASAAGYDPRGSGRCL
ncbi:MAG: hypothetical protein AAFQ04_02120 [Pseudomonadota bacterium]